MLFFLVIVTFVTSQPGDSINPGVYNSTQNSKTCSIKQFEGYYFYKSCTGIFPNGENSGIIAEGGECTLIDPETTDEVQTVCKQGIWEYFVSSLKVLTKRAIRKKRFIGLLLFGLGALFGGIIGYAMRGGSRAPANSAPTITCPSPVPSDPVAGPLQETVKVSWGNPTRSDPDGDSLSVSQVAGESRGSMFPEGGHIVQYKVTDNKGASDTCTFSFTVAVITCPSPEWPKDGKLSCDHQGYIYGTTCSYDCEEGFWLNGTTARVCQKSKGFNGTTPTCSRVECPALLDPDNGRITCSNGYLYQSTCATECDEGYDVGNSTYTRCKADRTWTQAVQSCQDIQAPKFTYCPVGVNAYAGRNSTTVGVSWRSPNATDNHDHTVTVQQTQGQPSGSNFEVGVHQQRYIARDSSGNESPPCQFNVIVEELVCGSPDTVFNDTFLYTRCDNGYGFGSECELHCSDNYQLLGNVTTTSCERNGTSNIVKWEWGSEPEPRCNSDICPDLTPPINGALACSRVGVNEYCTMSCNEKYDVPRTVDIKDYIVCNNKGEWIPPSVPDCTERRNPTRSVLPGEYYYSGDCSNENVQNQIKQNFLTIVNSQPGEEICPPSTCSINSINVKCGEKQSRRRKREDKPKRKKRSGKFVILRFKITLTWQNTNQAPSDELVFNEDKITEIFDDLASRADDVAADVTGVTYDSTYKDWTDVECDVGTTAVYSSTGVACSGCPTGTMYNSTKDDCSLCPRGTYQDEAFQDRCTPCPSGTYTAKEGSKNKTQCIDKCAPGYYSPRNGLEPCVSCPKGTYQSVSMTKECKQCSSLKTTNSKGSISESACTVFDVLVGGVGSAVQLKPLSHNVSTFTLGFRMNCPIDTEAYPVLKLGNPNVANVEITGSNPPSVSLFGKSIDVPKGEVTWNSVVLRFHELTKTVTVFVNGNNNDYTLNVTSTTVTRNGDQMWFTYSNDQKSSECILSGFFLVNRSLPNEEILDISRTCTPILSDALYTMEDFKSINNIENGIQLSTPSLCDAIDECESSPCGVHRCKNLLNGYRCTCNKGYTGAQCDVASDYCRDHECQNGATCKSQTWNYTCECVPGYRGRICEETIVNGHWSDWSLWGACSVTCAGGTRVRTRSCTNPPPDPDGSNCAGNSAETQTCSSTACPQCPSSSTIRTRYSRVMCTSNENVKSCTASCRPGFVWSIEPHNPYYCGANTSHVWQPAPKVPECIVPKSPSEIALQSAVSVTNLSCTESSTNALLNTVDISACEMSATCTHSVKTSGCESSKRKRRSTSTKVSIEIVITLKESDNLDLEGYQVNGTISDGLNEYIDAVKVLGPIAQRLNASLNTSTITVNGTIYQIDPSSFGMTANLTCSSGSVPHQGVCVDCSPGTRYNAGHCDWCEMGTYQDSSGQADCIECPAGFTTMYLGSSNVTDCSVEMENNSTTITTVGSPPTLELETSAQDVLFIACIVGTLTIGLSVIAVSCLVFYMYRKSKRRKFRLEAYEARPKPQINLYTSC